MRGTPCLIKSICRSGYQKAGFESFVVLDHIQHVVISLTRDYVDEFADLFDQRLTKMSQWGVNIDTEHWPQCYAFDVIELITCSQR